MTDQPNPPADGRNGHWVKLGQVGVDSAPIAITDLLVGPARGETTMICGELSPHCAQCGLELHHAGTHYSREAECVWLGRGYHMHDCRPAQPVIALADTENGPRLVDAQRLLRKS